MNDEATGRDDAVRQAAGPTADDSAAINEPVLDTTFGSDWASGAQDVVPSPGVVRSPEHAGDDSESPGHLKAEELVVRITGISE